jgi:hypothetical protein
MKPIQWPLRLWPIPLLLALLVLSSCADPNLVLDVDRFNMQFNRRGVVIEGEDGLLYSQPPPGDYPQKRVTISNRATQTVHLYITLEGENADAFLLPPAFGDLPEPFNFPVEPNSRLELNIAFRGEVVGTNLARAVIHAGTEEDEGWTYQREIVLQGNTDCVSLEMDRDQDGYCDSTLHDGEGGGDCDDLDYDVNPDAIEVCDDGNQVDNDCDGNATVVVDLDNDGWCDFDASCAADLANLAAICDSVDGDLDLVRDNDCNDDPDDGADLNPGAAEVCESGDQVDNNCDPSDDEQPLSEYWLDADGDGFGDELTEPQMLCGGASIGFAPRAEDCDDTRATVNPDAKEVCDGLDNDCDDCKGERGDGCPGTGWPEIPDDYDDDADGRPLCGVAGNGEPLDCDDLDDEVYLGHPEECDGKDNDCIADPEIDHPSFPGIPAVEFDDDTDGYVECATDTTPIPPYMDEADCDDLDPTINPGQPEIPGDLLDNDCDGLLHEDETDGDIDGMTEWEGDCDDSQPTVYLGADELCDGLDNDCDGLIPIDEQDHDGDGYVECFEEGQPWPIGYWGLVGFAGGGDCNDDPSDIVSPDVYPYAPELSDSYWEPVTGVFRQVDNQCPGNPGYDTDGVAGVDGDGNDEYCLDAFASTTCNGSEACYACTGSEFDVDGDGFTEAQGDCDDAAADRAPWLPEICDGIDNDCDGFLPLSETDGDGDGFVQCWPAPDVVGLVGGDCDPADAAINPDAVEINDGGIDNDCDASTTEEDLVDEDGDGVTADTDCDDFDPTVYPGATELCDGLDNDCDGLLGDGTLGPDELDADGDGYTICGDADCVDSATQLFDEYLSMTGDVYVGSTANAWAASTAIHPGAMEVCDGWDNNCGGDAALLFLPDPTNTPDEYDDDEDGFVECQDGAIAVLAVGWLTFADQANANLNGANDCADTTAQTNGISNAPAQPLEPMASIYPGNLVEDCDGWDNACIGLDPALRPWSQAHSAEWDDDGDQYIECDGAQFVSTGQVNDFGELILGGDDCLDDATDHFQTGQPIGFIGLADLINPAASEICDGFNTDCSFPWAGDQDGDGIDDVYDATDANSTFDEDDTDEDDWIECAITTASLVPGFGVNDCLDDSQPHFQTNSTITLSVAAMVNPAATEVCDGFNTDCSAPLDVTNPYDANDSNSPSIEEDDTDEDDFIECTSTHPSLAPGIGLHDCLDENTFNPDTSVTMTAADVGANVFPGAAEACDGLNTDCSTPLAANIWDANDSNSNLEEDDTDGDNFVECETAAGWIAEVGFEIGDCLDEVTVHFATGAVMPLTVAELVNPDMAEVCDGLNTDCSGTLAFYKYDANDTNSTMEEDDADDDLYLECDPAAAYIADTGYGVGDCLDEATNHFQTGDLMTRLEVGRYINPGATEVCDGLNTDCSLPLAGDVDGDGTPDLYNANDSNSTLEEDDTDEDGYLECGSPAFWIDGTGFAVGDCLDENTFNPDTGQTMTAVDVGANVHPFTTEVCDGLNTDCSAPLAAVIWDATDANSTMEEDDFDQDGYLECTSAAAWLADVGFETGDCLDEDTTHFQTGALMLASVVGVNVHPTATEVCDGLNTDCDGALASPAYDASDSNSTMEEDDADLDTYLECSSPAGWIGAVGFAIGDCLDESTIHFETGANMLASEVGIHVHPGAGEVCDGLNTDCSSPLATNIYDASDANSTMEEDDADLDTYLQCGSAAAWIGDVGLATGDCLDEQQNHWATSQLIDLTLAALINPGRPEICDGFNTDCSATLGSPLYDAVDSNDAAPNNTALGEGDLDGDHFVECLLGGVSDVPGYESLDCDEDDIETNPGEFDDFTFPLVDNDCDTLVDEEGLTAGDIVVTEVHANPNGSPTSFEWFEIHNTSTEEIDLVNWSFRDDGVDLWEIPATLIIDVGEYITLCRNPDQADAAGVGCANRAALPSTTPWPWGSDYQLDNGSDEIQVFTSCVGEVAPCSSGGDLQLDEVAWDNGWDFAANDGIAKGFTPDITTGLESANDSNANWCFQVGPWSGGDYGTPGRENADCDASEQDNDLDGFCEDGIDLDADGDCNSPAEVATASAAILAGCVGGLCDCLDDNPEVAPSEAEVCDGWDTDCSTGLAGAVPEDTDEIDNDTDTFIECTAFQDHDHPTVADGDDCNDGNATIYDGAPESCDLIDSDCDLSIVDEDPDYEGDLTPDCVDTDDDNDGVVDGSDDCAQGDVGWTANAGTDHDDDGCQDAGEDTDDDNDGVLDGADSCQTGSLNWTSNSSTDHDGDGCKDGAPDAEDNDDDNDGIADGADDCQTGDTGWTSNGSTDHDTDGCQDASSEDLDDDNDGIADTSDDCSTGDLGWTSTGGTDYDTDGCRDAGEDLDDDNDGQADGQDDCQTGNMGWTSNGSTDYDDDGCQDASGEDTDDDNDGIADGSDDCATGDLNWTSNGSTDHDTDGCRDAGEDTDDDNDGMADGPDDCPTGDLGWTSNGSTDFDSDGCQDAGEDTNDDNDPVSDPTDCDDYDASIYPGAPEACDSIDSDCDFSLVDDFDNWDGDAQPDCVDTDDDNDGDLDTSDCNDFDNSIYTGATEICDSIDSDCDGSIVDEFTDTDGDGTPDCVDVDSDNDGIGDVDDDCPTGNTGWTSNGATDHDSDGCQDASSEDLDDDNDGIADTSDDCSTGDLGWTSTGATDYDTDGCRDAGVEDGDDDNDGIVDTSDTCAKGSLGWTSNGTTDHDSDGCKDGSPNAEDPDDDNDGMLDGPDDCPTGDLGWTSGPATDHDGDGCRDGGEDTDDDNDGMADGPDDCPTGDTGWTSNGTTDHDSDGCRDAGEDTDDDNDGMSDGPDDCEKGDLGWTSNGTTDYDSDGCQDSGEDTDDDNDGMADGPDDCEKGNLGWTSNASTDHDSDGCRDAGEDTDDDNDSVLDGSDDCQTGSLSWTSNSGTDHDGDGCKDDNPNAEDNDDDNDSYADGSDDCSKGEINWVPTSANDNDGDGCKDDTAEDTDDDNDGMADGPDDCPSGNTGWTSNGTTDYDTDGCQDASSEDTDDDNDGVADTGDDCAKGSLGWTSNGSTDYDSDGCKDGAPDAEDGDDDNDGVADGSDSCATGSLGWTSNASTDHDGDGCKDGAPDAEDSDDDNDGVTDGSDDCPTGATGWTSNGSTDFDGDGCQDSGEDTDDDNDGDADGTDCDDNDVTRCTGCAEVVDDGIDQSCNGFDSISCYLDSDNDTYGTTLRVDIDASCNGDESTTPGDCNDAHAGVHPAAVLPESPGSTTDIAACDDTDDDGYCLGGGRDVNDNGHCEDVGEDMDSFASGIVADCDETTSPAVDPESVIDHVDNGSNTLIDESCYGGGEVIVVEYYSDDVTASEPDWFELFNAAWWDVDLDGWVIDDTSGAGGSTITVNASQSISVGDVDVLCKGAVTGVTCMGSNWASQPFTLLDLDGANAQFIEVQSGAVVVDGMSFTTAWNVATVTTSSQLDPDTLINALVGITDPNNAPVGNWCDTVESSDTWSAGTATPGVANPACP